MQTYNDPARVLRETDFGHVWMEVLQNAATTGIEVSRYTAVRVRAVAACVVSFDGVTAASLAAGEILIFNSGRGLVGPGQPSATKKTVTLAVTAAAYVQVAAMTELEIENQVTTASPFGATNDKTP